MDLPQRKKNRLPDYDYSTPNAYFITICTANRKNLFWDNAGAIIDRPLDVCLSAYGKIVDQAILAITRYYPMVSVDKYVIMPNHIHLLIQISAGVAGRSVIASTKGTDDSRCPSLSVMIRQMKTAVSRQIGYSIWQKSFYDHVIRNDRDYADIWEYIDNNPMKWLEDHLYTE